jgi:hypothetical protein
VTGGGQEATGTPRVEQQEVGSPDDPADQPARSVEATRFAHASEAEMARILDFYQVRWEYEPTTFPILWNLDGGVVESFAPDFYLPDLEMFLEMTTLKQRLVRKKNRKLRRLRELYPDIRIKLFYARDFRAMMLKYGRLGLAESLSGTVGQVVPERPVLGPEEPPAIEAAIDVVELDAQDAIVDATGTLEVGATPDAAPASGGRTIAPAASRATPRTRPSRRRGRAAVTTKAGADREARA